MHKKNNIYKVVVLVLLILLYIHIQSQEEYTEIGQSGGSFSSSEKDINSVNLLKSPNTIETKQQTAFKDIAGKQEKLDDHQKLKKLHDKIADINHQLKKMGFPHSAINQHLTPQEKSRLAQLLVAVEQLETQSFNLRYKLFKENKLWEL